MAAGPGAASILPDEPGRHEEPRSRRPKRAGGGRCAPRDKTPPRPTLLLKHPRTRKTAEVPLGFAWTLFLFSGFLGAPLFLRGLHLWGAAILGLWVADLAAGWLGAGGAGAAQPVLFCAFLAVQAWLGLKGNEMTAKAYLARGWVVVDPADAATRRLMMRWRLDTSGAISSAARDRRG